jgi:hypothetical protein
MKTHAVSADHWVFAQNDRLVAVPETCPHSGLSLDQRVQRCVADADGKVPPTPENCFADRTSKDNNKGIAMLVICISHEYSNSAPGQRGRWKT